MWWSILAGAVGVAAKWVSDETRDEVNKEIDQQLKKHIDKYIHKELTYIKQEINHKTVIYIIWSSAGILLMNLSFQKTVYYLLSFIMALTLIYIMATSYKSLWRLWSLLDTFEENIRQFLTKKLEKAKQDSLKTQIGLWLSGRQYKDFEDFFISHIVKSLLRLIKNYKRIIFIRVLAYVIAILLFKEVFENIIRNSDFYNIFADLN